MELPKDMSVDITVEENVFTMLSKPLQKAVKEKGFVKPTEAQRRAIPLILRGENVLLIAPTAHGKTESAVLPVLDRVISMADRERGIKALYITPLRALNRDMLDRLTWWCDKLCVSVSVRHGDTDVKERSLQARSPPTMLITTPETLQAIIPGRVMKRHLSEVRHVIVDEVHELADSKRGSQLSLALERLREMAKEEFQIVGLSATIGTPEQVARFLVGVGRDVKIVRIPVGRRSRLKVLYPEPGGEDRQLALKLYTHPEVAARLRVMEKLINAHNSALLFTNTRSIAEVLASRFRVWNLDFPISIHHGSLAKPARITAETGLKSGKLKGIVCTSSLELGIDIGAIDYTIQYMSPRQVTRLIQRLGRSGHKVDLIADGAIIAMDEDDALEAMVIGRKTFQEELEPVKIPEKPLDALAHQLVGLLTQRGRWRIGEILNLFTKAYPYRNLTEEELMRVLTYLHDRYPRMAWVSFEDKIVLRPRRAKALYEYYFGKLSMIPDEKQYLVVDETSDTPVGVLDEAFVAEYAEPGAKFIVKGSPWKMMSIRGDKIFVKPISDPTGAIPSWVGEEIPVPLEVASEVGRLRRAVLEALDRGESLETLASQLSKQYPSDKSTVLRALRTTVEQREQGYPVPTDDVVVVEDWEDYTIIHAHFGTLVNRSLGMLIGHLAAEELGHTVMVQQDAYRIIVQGEGSIRGREIFEMLKEVEESELTALLSKAAEKTGLFKRRLVHVARRFGAISKWVDFTSLSLNRLIKSFKDTVIFEEAMKETLSQDLDPENACMVLRMMKSGEVKVEMIQSSGELSPISQLAMRRASMKTDLIPPDKMERIILDSARARILSESVTIVCASCWGFCEVVEVKTLKEGFRCPRCKSKSLGILNYAPEKLSKLLRNRGVARGKSDKRILEEVLATASLFEKFGVRTAYVMAGRKVTPHQAREILSKTSIVGEELFKLILEAEREALKRSF
ncbi:MAG: DEAD/DEAH box helicase [Candidatus Bathyarchaeia archaeon]